VFLERANLRSPVETRVRGVVRIHRLMLSPNRSAAAAPRPRPARAAYPPR
jgi:hypothetical protein